MPTPEYKELLGLKMSTMKTASMGRTVGLGGHEKSLIRPYPAAASVVLKTSSTNNRRASAHKLRAWELVISKSNSLHFQIMVVLEIYFLNLS